jgi:hypothetical protein
MNLTKAQLLEQRNTAFRQRQEMHDAMNEAKDSAREEGSARHATEAALRELLRSLYSITKELTPMAHIAVRALITQAEERAEL